MFELYYKVQDLEKLVISLKDRISLLEKTVERLDASCEKKYEVFISPYNASIKRTVKK